MNKYTAKEVMYDFKSTQLRFYYSIHNSFHIDKDANNGFIIALVNKNFSSNGKLFVIFFVNE